MKAVVVYEAGGPEALQCREVPTPEARPGWTLVKVRGVGVNHSEIFTREGKSPSVSFPRILGIECVGQVERTFNPRLHAGQTVVSIMGEMGRAFDGGYAQYALLPDEQVYPVSTSLPWEQLAAVPETYYTAFGSLERLRIEDGDDVLVRGATSGVGVAFLKLVKALYPSCRVAGSTRSAQKGERLLGEGFDRCVVDDRNALKTEDSFDAILDLVGPAAAQDTFAHIRPGGTVCITGLLGGQWTLDGFDPIVDTNGGCLTGFYSGDVDGERLQALISTIEDRQIDVKPERTFRLSEMRQAHAYLASRDSFGKAVAIPEFDE